MTAASSDNPQPSTQKTSLFVRRVIWAGWTCVVLSALLLYLSKAVDAESDAGNFLWAMLLMAARACGLASFAIGGVAIYNGRWNQGVLLMLLAIVLPVIAFLVHGTI